MLLPAFVLALLGTVSVQAKDVFAHFLVGNAVEYKPADWDNDFKLAQEAHISAFAMNIATGKDWPQYLDMAFKSAKSTGFKLFFSFDYLGGSEGSWTADQVITLVNQYKGHEAYYNVEDKPLVTTFEGIKPDDMSTYAGIKESTGCFFMPEWSGFADPALAVSKGGDFADGQFNWGAWPYTPKAMNTSLDELYMSSLGSKPYMMAVSPWLYTNLPGYGKNWVDGGNDLWHVRWNQVLELQPAFVEIVTWNDYGESHYIGPNFPLGENMVMDEGAAPFNFVSGRAHDGWRKFLPYLIDSYVKGSASIDEEAVMAWYMTSTVEAGNSDGSAAQQWGEAPAEDILKSEIFFSALLKSPAAVSVTVGGKNIKGSWSSKPEGGQGVYFGSISMLGSDGVAMDGKVSVKVTRCNGTVAEVTGPALNSSSLTDKDYTNFNPVAVSS